MTLLVQTFCVICGILILLAVLQTERFVNPNVISLMVETRKDTLFIDNEDGIEIGDYISKHPVLKITSENSAPAACRVCDALDVQNKEEVLSVIPDQEKVVVFVVKQGGPKTLQRLIQDTMLIYVYNNKRHLDVLSTILESSGMMTNQISKYNSFRSSFLDGTKSCIMFFDTIRNIRNYVSQLQRNVDFVDYEAFDINLLKLRLPVLYHKNYDMTQAFPSYSSKEIFKRLIAADVFIVCDPNKIVGFESDLYHMVVDIDQVAVNNYYTMLLPYNHLTLQYLGKYNRHIISRDTLPILEQYEDDNQFAYEVTKNIAGYFDSASKQLFVRDNVPLISGHTYILKHQDRDEENGTFVSDGQVLRKVDDVNMQKLPGREDPNDPRFKCFGDPTIQNKTACESPFDEQGRVKPFQTYWDRPCETNRECPFYQANKHYPNYRGGCNDGFCEMPIGVKRRAYRLYDATSNPLCHGCGLLDDKCCEMSKDYAFELDTHDRRVQQIV